jgi:hypothetical protein
MYLKATNGVVEKYPYSIGLLRIHFQRIPQMRSWLATVCTQYVQLSEQTRS